MSEEINRDRRRFLTAAAMTLASAQLGVKGSADAQSTKPKPATVPAIKPGTNTSFGALKQIDAGVLNIGYAEAGAADGPAVILLHGWPTIFIASSTSRPCWRRRATGLLSRICAAT